MEKKGGMKMILAIIGALVVIGGAVVAIIHFWEDIKKKLPCCKDEFEDFEDLDDLLEDEFDELAEEVTDEVEDFVEFEEL